MIVAVTGHRPDKLGGYRTPNPTFNSVMEGLDKALLDLRPEKVIIGMALGVDQWMAELCIWNGIPFEAAVPFNGFESRWPAFSQVKFRQLLERASAVHVVCEGEYAPWKMQRRNQWMVDNCDRLIAVFNGTDGGTANCISYAQLARKPITFVPFTAPPTAAPVERPVARVEIRPADQVLRDVPVPRVNVFRRLNQETEGERAARRRAREAMQEEQRREADQRRQASNQRFIESLTQLESPEVDRIINRVSDSVVETAVRAVEQQVASILERPREGTKREEGPVVRDFARVIELDES